MTTIQAIKILEAHDLLSHLQRSLSETQNLSQQLTQTLSNLARDAADLSQDHDKNYQQLKTFLSYPLGINIVFYVMTH